MSTELNAAPWHSDTGMVVAALRTAAVSSAHADLLRRAADLLVAKEAWIDGAKVDMAASDKEIARLSGPWPCCEHCADYPDDEPHQDGRKGPHDEPCIHCQDYRAERDAARAELAAIVRSVEGEVARLNEDIAAKDDFIAQVKAERDAARAERDGISRHLQDSQAERRRLGAALALQAESLEMAEIRANDWKAEAKRLTAVHGACDEAASLRETIARVTDILDNGTVAAKRFGWVSPVFSMTGVQYVAVEHVRAALRGTHTETSGAGGKETGTADAPSADDPPAAPEPVDVSPGAFMQTSHSGCSCSCHSRPGVAHIVACCDEPPYREPHTALLDGLLGTHTEEDDR